MSSADERAGRFLEGITWLRVILTPIVMALVLHGGDRDDAIAAALFAVAAATDFVDGRLARRWKRTSQLGAFLDTTADKVLVTGVLIALVAVGRASAWVAFVIIAREIVVFGLKGVASSAEGSIVTPSRLGKAKANLQFFAIFVAICAPRRRARGAVPRRVADVGRRHRHGLVRDRLRRSVRRRVHAHA